MNEIPTLDALRCGGKRALAQALSLIEMFRDSDALAELLDAAVAAPKGSVLGLTGPPGVGKSTLTNALVRDYRCANETVAVIAVDPSSRASGGALLGDRARIVTDPGDRGVFVRSMAARDRLGGLSDDTVAAAVLMRALYDRTIVESVGIGQSEADISFVADTVVLCIQPGSGDSLQFMKAGVLELPDIVVVTKADTGALARRAASDVEGALSLFSRTDAWNVPVLLVSAAQATGLDALREQIEAHRTHLGADGVATKRRRQQHVWIESALQARFGREGVAHATRWSDENGGPFSRIADRTRRLRALFHAI